MDHPLREEDTSPDVMLLGRFRLDRRRRELVTSDGRQAPLRRQALLVLLALAERAGHVVSKDELMELVWPGKIVTDDSLVQAVADIRRLFGSDGEAVVKAVPRRGYLLEASARQAEAIGGVKLFGRDDDLAMLRAQMTTHRLVTLTGPGGIGKTRLGEAIARTVPDAVSVDLSALNDPELVDGAVAAGFGISLKGGPGRRRLLVSSLASREGLLFVDNCEHLVDAIGQLLQALADGAPHLHFLATSRTPLHVASEQVFRLEGLRFPRDGVAAGEALNTGALALFVARAQAADHRFALDGASAQFALDICRRLEGMPLAIEMAAARVAAFGVVALADLVVQKMGILSAANRDSPLRHRTLDALYDWSYRLLDDATQAVFRRLSVFPGAFDLAAAEAIAAGPGVPRLKVSEAVVTLTDHSLLIAMHGTPPSWRLHATASEAALQKLANAEERATTTTRHLQFIVQAYETLFDRWFTMSDAEWRDRTDGLQGDLRAALVWATGAGMNAAAAATLMGASLPDWQWRDFQAYYEGIRWANAIGDLSPAAMEPRRAARWRYAQSALMPLWSIERMTALQEAEVDASEAGDTELQIQINIDMAETAQGMGDLVTAQHHLAATAVLLPTVSRGRLQGLWHMVAGEVARRSGDNMRARDSYLAARSLLNEVGADCLATHAELELGQTLWDLGYLAEGLAVLRSAAESSSQSRFGDDHVNAFSLLFAAGICLEMTDLQGAGEYIYRALDPLRRTGYALDGVQIISAALAMAGSTEHATWLASWAESGQALAGSPSNLGVERVKELCESVIGSEPARASSQPFATHAEMEEAMLAIARSKFGATVGGT